MLISGRLTEGVNPFLLMQVESELQDLKNKISDQSRKNFLLDRELRFLDNRIALLVKNRLAWKDINAWNLVNPALLTSPTNDSASSFLDEQKFQNYGNLFFLLQTEPQYLSRLLQCITLAEMDTLMQTVMFTLFGNQYERREELLLLSVFQMVLSAQFELKQHNGEMNNLLRENTPASRMMTMYTRRGPGQSYLKSILASEIDSILKDDSFLNLEIDPNKIRDEMQNANCWSEGEESGSESQSPSPLSDVELNEIIRTRAALLEERTEHLLTSIYNSLSIVPYGIRWICRQIKLLTMKHFPNAPASQITPMISGFFLLRFINPAIVTPQAYFLVDSSPSKNSRRTLTLIAKLLQFIANKPNFAKEQHMKIFYPFISRHHEEYVKFLENLCQVDDFNSDLEMDRYLALQRMEMTVSITENEIFNTHSLLESHLDSVAGPKQTDHLREILKDLGSPPAQVSRDQNSCIKLPLRSRWEALDVGPSEMYQKNLIILETKRALILAVQKKCYHADQLARGRGDSMNEVTLVSIDALTLGTDNLLRATTTPRESSNSKSTGESSEFYEPKIPSPISNDHFEMNIESLEDILGLIEDPGQLKGTRENVEFLKSLPEFNESHFLSDVIREWSKLDTTFKNVNTEFNELKDVYRVICDHNTYLTGQLEDYKKYLMNVRIKAASGLGENSSTSISTSISNSNSNSNNNANGALSIGIEDLISSNSVKGSAVGSAAGSAAGSGSATPTISSHLPSNQLNNNNNMTARFTHHQLVKEGVIKDSSIPVSRRLNIYISITSPLPGSFCLYIFYRGRDKPLAELQVTLDDLLEKQVRHLSIIDLEYVQIDVSKLLLLLGQIFILKKTNSK